MKFNTLFNLIESNDTCTLSDMTIEEAILHAKDTARELGLDNACGRNHKQLAEWLEELIYLRNKHL